jgi:hypothetical protein
MYLSVFSRHTYAATLLSPQASQLTCTYTCMHAHQQHIYTICSDEQDLPSMYIWWAVLRDTALAYPHAAETRTQLAWIDAYDDLFHSHHRQTPLRTLCRKRQVRNELIITPLQATQVRIRSGTDAPAQAAAAMNKEKFDLCIEFGGSGDWPSVTAG